MDSPITVVCASSHSGLGEAASSFQVAKKSKEKKKRKNSKFGKLKQLGGLFVINKSYLLRDSVSRKALKKQEQCVLLLSGIFFFTL